MRTSTAKNSRPERPTGKESQSFAEEATRILRAAMQRRDVSYKQLAELLSQASDEPTESEQALINKVNRGRFSFAFFVRACRAMDVGWVDISSLDSPDSRTRVAPTKSGEASMGKSGSS